MKVTALLRYPRVERGSWKRDLLERLTAEGYDVSVIFGESSRWRHLKAAVKQYGPELWRVRRDLEASREPRILDFCHQRGIPVERVPDLNDERCRRRLLKWAPDLLLLLGTGIIRAPVLDVPRLGTVHCHQGQLPAFRGVNTIEWSIFEHRDVYITTHLVDPGIDTGRILQAQQVPVLPGDTVASLRKRCQQNAVRLLLETIAEIRAGHMDGKPQEPGTGKQYFAMHPFYIAIVEQMLADGTQGARTVA